jgi:hypothetical protein
VRLALPDRLVRPAPKALKASKDPSVPRARWESRGRLALQHRQDRLARRGRREKRVAKAQSAPPASADPQARKAPLAHLAQPDRRARRMTLARHQQFAWSPVRIAFAAETTKCWPVLFAQAVRSTERSARPLERPQPVYVYVGESWSARRDGRLSDRPRACVVRAPLVGELCDHGSSLQFPCGIFVTLGKCFRPITLLGDFAVRMSQSEHVGACAWALRQFY